MVHFERNVLARVTPATARSDGARVRYITSNEWSTRRYLDMSRLGETVREAN